MVELEPRVRELGGKEPDLEPVQGWVGDTAADGTTEWTAARAKFPEGKAGLMVLDLTGASSRADQR